MEVLDALLKSPLLPEVVEKANIVLQKEKAARRKFLEDLTPEMKAEFIEGEVILHSPAKVRHLDTTLELVRVLGNYVHETGNGRAFSEKALVTLTRNCFEPDVLWYSPEKAAELEPDQMKLPAPDFVVEILSKSTEDRDRGVKFIDYALHGVREYWIIDTEAKTVEQYLLNEKERIYELSEKLAHGTAQSSVIENFEIELKTLFS